MRLSRTVSSISAISLFSLLLTSAYAHDGGWVSDSSGKGVRDSAKQCVKSSGGNSLDCAPKVEPPPPPPPPPPVKVTPPPPPPPPKPKPRPRPPQVQILNLNEAGGSNFATDSAKLRPAALARLDEFVAKVKRSGVTPSAITIVGHTDSRGSVKYNQRLSERRAQSVADYLASQGINGNMQVGGRGELEPVASNRTSAGRAQNRRVDIRVTGQRRVTR